MFESSKQDVVVVGGGIIGLAIAFELHERGRQVLILDEGRMHGPATPAAAGMLSRAAEADVELPGLTEFRHFSHDLYPDFIARLEAQSGMPCGLSTVGSLFVAIDRDQRAEMERLAAILTDQGFTTRPVSAEAALQLEPALSPRVIAALHLVDDHHVDQRATQLALRSLLNVHTARVQQVGRDGVVSGDGFELQAEVVVLATGSWMDLGINLPVRPVKGQTLRLHAPGLLQRVIRTPNVYIVPHLNGTVVIGASVEEQGFNIEPTAGATFDLLRHAWRVLPGIYDLPLRELSVGLRPTARDHLPVIGRLDDSRLIVANGHYRGGILWAPGTARMVCDLICDGKEHDLLQRFNPQRFTRAFIVNGKRRRLEAPLALAALPELAAATTGTAVAVNGEVVLRRDWSAREVKNGDAIEIVQAVQGG